MLPALPWQVLPSPSKAIKHYNPVLTLAEMSFEVIIVRGGMSDSRVGVSSSLEWACKVLNSVCITMDKILNVSISSVGLHSWEQAKGCRTPERDTRAVRCRVHQEHAQGCFILKQQNLLYGSKWCYWQCWGILGQSRVAALECAQGTCVWYPRGDPCCSVAGCAFEGLTLYWEGTIAGNQKHPAGV